MRFSILGPVEVHADGLYADLRGMFQRRLLIALLVGQSRVALVDALMEELWSESPPRRAENALQAHVSRLRRKLEILDGERVTPRLVALPSGYRLLVEEEELDAALFMRALSEVRAQPHLNPVDAVHQLRAALSLWRGHAFGGVPGGPICQAACARYEQSRLAALELLFDNELKIGRHTEIIPELSELIEAGSLNERLCQQLMVALYRAGRQADALAVYRKLWSRLNDELGVEPSPTLRKYERAILAHDPVLATTPSVAPGVW